MRLGAFEIILAVASLSVGTVAAIAGFGIGSFLTPLFSVQIGIRLAVAAASIPHLAGTMVRFWTLRRFVDRQILMSFGVLSAIGSFAGALLHTYAPTSSLTIVFACILIFAGAGALFGWSEKMRFGRKMAWTAGGVSGALGGMVGNQGGIRSAAMLGFDIHRDSFVATATAIALIVDAARMPVYLATQWKQIVAVWPLVLIATIGTFLGTLVGDWILPHVSERGFRRFVAGMIVLLGVYMLMGWK
jgi:uncharacterized membrane protein YfcA